MRAGRRTRWWSLAGTAVTGVDGSVERAVPCAPAHRRRQSRVPGVPRRCTRPHSRRPAGPGRPAELPRDGDHTPVAGGLGANVQSEFTEGSGRRLLAPAVAPVADAPAVVEPSTTLRPIPALAPVSERRWTSRQQELPIPGPCATLAQASDPVAAVPWCRSPRAERSRCPRSVAVRTLTIGPWVRALGPECHWPQSQVVAGEGPGRSGTPRQLWAGGTVLGGGAGSAATHFGRSESRAGGTPLPSSEAGEGGPAAPLIWLHGAAGVWRESVLAERAASVVPICGGAA